MKKIALFSLLFSVFALNAQVKITAEEQSRPMSKGTYPSFLTDIPNAKLKTIEKEWSKYLTKGSKSKIEEVNGEWQIHGAVNKNIFPSPFNVYSKLLETKEGVRLTIWITQDDSVFISKDLNNDQDLAAKKYLTDFAADQYRDVVKDELDAEKDKLKKLEKELDDLVKSEEKSNNRIKENMRSIERNKNDIKINDEDQKRKIEQISAQKTVVEATKAGGGDPYKEAQKALSNLNSEKEKLEKQNEKLNKEIDNWEKENRDEDRNMKQSQQDQFEKTQLIAKQKVNVTGVENKLAGIK